MNNSEARGVLTCMASHYNPFSYESNALCKAVELLEKHEVKKPVLNSMHLPACPVCKAALVYNINKKTDYIYCYVCGQEIDWTGE